MISLGFGLVAAIGISQVMGRGNSSQVPTIQKKKVLVAAVDLEHNSLLDKEKVKIEEWPVEIIPPNAASKLEEIEEMATRQSLAKGMPIITTSIVHKKKLNDIDIPKGYTVISIKVKASDTHHGMLQPGDKVNVIGMLKSDKRPAKTFLRGLRVWSVNSQLTAKSVSREESSSNTDAIVGILANERQSELIFQVQSRGELKLVLRGDHTELDNEEGVDQEGISALGLDGSSMDDMTAVPTTAPANQDSGIASWFAPQKSTDTKTMKVWNFTKDKREAEKVIFRNGEVVPPGPIDNYQSPFSAFSGSNQAPLSNSNGSADYGDLSDRDRGFEEDQF